VMILMAQAIPDRVDLEAPEAVVNIIVATKIALSVEVNPEETTHMALVVSPEVTLLAQEDSQEVTPLAQEDSQVEMILMDLVRPEETRTALVAKQEEMTPLVQVVAVVVALEETILMVDNLVDSREEIPTVDNPEEIHMVDSPEETTTRRVICCC